jgi:hypothetical protein
MENQVVDIEIDINTGSNSPLIKPFPCPVGWTVDLAESRIRSCYNLVGGRIDIKVTDLNTQTSIPLHPASTIEAGNNYIFRFAHINNPTSQQGNTVHYVSCVFHQHVR